MKAYLKTSPILLLAGTLAACSGGTETTANTQSANSGDVANEVADAVTADLPPGVMPAVEAAVPGMKVEEAERKEREGRVYYDVEGTRPDGSEVELDLLQKGDTFEVVEIQRDIPWTEAPENVRKTATASPKTFEPVRVIESKQTDDSIIYELFKADQPDKPALEVQLKDNAAKVLTEEWPH